MSTMLKNTLHSQMDAAIHGLGLPSLDGAQASAEIGGQLAPEQQINDLVFDPSRYDLNKRFSQLLMSHDSVERFGECIGTLSGYMIYLAQLEAGKMVIRPALVGGALTDSPRLSLYELGDNNLSPDGVDNQQLVLSGIKQFGAESIASHERVAKVGAEAGHLIVALGGSLLPNLGRQISQGNDVTDSMKAKGNLLTTLARDGADMMGLPGRSVTYDFQQWQTANQRLIWPLTHHFESGPRRTDIPDAVAVATVQGFQKVRAVGVLDDARRLIERTVAA